jgi:transcription initiation factor IIE alpha subunit
MFNGTKERLYTGIFQCPACDTRYDITDAYEDELTCEECGADLEPEDDTDEDDEDEGEEETVAGHHFRSCARKVA